MGLRRILAIVATASAITVAAAAAVIGGQSTAAGAAAAPPVRHLTVATFNIHHAQGTDEVLNLDRVARVIKASHADLIGVEEVDNHYSARSNFLDEPAELAARLHMHYVFGANLVGPPGAPGQPDSEYGTLILSRYPILQTKHVLLPKSPDQEQRGLTGALVEVHGRQVWFYNTHLAASSATDRQAQADRLKQLIDPTAAPTFLTGDLNAGPDAPEIKTIAGFLDDVWPIAGRGDGLTYPSDGAHARIDFVFASPGLVQPRLAHVVYADPTASDHLPMAATVTIPAG